MCPSFACRRLAGLILLLITPACFGMIHEPTRHFFTLHTDTQAWPREPHFGGLLRVRDLDTDSPYDRMQLVLRKSPFELSYRGRELWAAKPARMVSDALARALGEGHVFAASTRELGERRPDYLLAGELHALEVDDTDGRFAAHLSFAVQLTQASTGEVVWLGEADLRRPVPEGDYRAAVQTLSRLLEESTHQFVQELLAHNPQAGAARAQMPQAPGDAAALGRPTP